MAIKCLISEKQATQYFFRYTLDDTKFLEDGTTPDPIYIREWEYAPFPPEGMKDSDYIAMMKFELPLLAQTELDAMGLVPTAQPTSLTGF